MFQILAGILSAYEKSTTKCVEVGGYISATILVGHQLLLQEFNIGYILL